MSEVFTQYGKKLRGERKRGLVILNSSAGCGRAARATSEIYREIDWAIKLSPLLINYRLVSTQSADAAMLQAAEAVKEGLDVVVAAGGDGTVSVVASALAGSETALGIIPLGISNNIARSYGIPDEVTPAINMIFEHHSICVDLPALKNGPTFVNALTFGLESLTPASLVRSKHWPLNWSKYPAALLSSVRDFAPKKMHIRGDDVEYKGSPLLVSVSKLDWFGSALRSKPKCCAEPTGFNVFIVNSSKEKYLAHTVPRVVSGMGWPKSDITNFCSATVSIIPEEALPFRLDGEPYMATYVTCVATSNTLRLLVPYKA